MGSDPGKIKKPHVLKPRSGSWEDQGRMAPLGEGRPTMATTFSPYIIPPVKPAKTATQGRVGASNGRKGFKPSANLVLIKNYFRLESTKAACALLNKEEIKGYRAEFTFEASLNRYLNLQKKKTFSNTICFTSAASDIDALALPASTYTRDIWGSNGTKILQTIDRAVSNVQSHGASTSELSEFLEFSVCIHALLNKSTVSITIHGSNLKLKMMGQLNTFPEIIEQVCWLVGFASETSISSLQKYNADTKNGTTTREYAETIYTGKPVIKSAGGHCFKVSFEPPRIEKLKNQDFVAKSGHCWKTLTGLSIIASGYSIPSRPREGSGLEAPLCVLRQLIKRGCSGQPFLLPDEPMAMFTPTAVYKVGKNDKGNQVDKAIVGYTVRLIMASGSEQQGNIIYWHFDPARRCKSNNPYQQLQTQSRVESSTINSKSRHFVGWSENAGLLATAPKAISSGVHARVEPRRHYELVIPAVSATVINSADTDKMYKLPFQKLLSVKARFFVLWDVDDKRGWLVSGDVVALHLLRAQLQLVPGSDLDFSTLNHLGDGSSSAYDVLSDEGNRRQVVWPPRKTLKEKLDSPDNIGPAKGQGEVTKVVLGEVVDDICDVLRQLSDLTRPLNAHPGLSGQVQDWYERRWGTIMRGWDFNDIATGKSANVYVRKLNKDPGWMRMTRELGATFLFTCGLGEIIEPRVGSCCPYFRTLPKGQNFLASNMEALKQIVVDYGGDPKNDEKDKNAKNAKNDKNDNTVARLNLYQGWERRLHPFQRPNCRGDHLNNLDVSCFPVQGLRRAPLDRDHPDKDDKWIEGGTVYKKGDILKMAGDFPNGVVVFGRQPDKEELRKLARPIQQENNPSAAQQKANAVPITARSTSGPTQPRAVAASSGTATASTKQTQPEQGNNGVGETRSGSSTTVASRSAKIAQQPSTTATPRASSVRSVATTVSASKDTSAENKQKASGQQSVASAQRAPSVSSVKSVDSNTRSKASDASAGSGQAQKPASHNSTASAHRATSNASLRNTNSIPRPKDASPGSSRSQASNTQSNAPTAARKPSTSSDSVSSKVTGGSQPQTPARQPSAVGLNRTTTNSSDETAGSHSTSRKQRSATQTAVANNRQQQQQQSQLGNATAAGLALDRPVGSNHAISSARATEHPRPTSSDVPSS
ncbi:hypothetical protein N8I77_003019 [Diaporthe amygdali]|uniref:Uncharacterized protein n=1 Tax=Phomopsis amygdali TaxID=1214568 RepID=A0AAD9SHY5_PHOAM|nr:hypothetical protein N8I77_003019 [Diaporthe amygdali]